MAIRSSSHFRFFCARILRSSWQRSHSEFGYMKCCTMLICTPSMAEIFLCDETNNIRLMLVGGEACIQGLETKVETFSNGYGPTEASIWCTGGNKPDTNTIGFPLPNTLCYVVHPDDGTVCPPGVSGELWVGGIGVGTIPYLSTFHTYGGCGLARRAPKLQYGMYLRFRRATSFDILLHRLIDAIV